MSDNNLYNKSISNNFNTKELKLNKIRNSVRLQSATLDEAEYKVWQGIKLERENNLDKAIEYYRQAVELNSQSAVAHHILAIALKKQNNLTEANYYHHLALSLSQNETEQNNTESLVSQHDSTVLMNRCLSKSSNLTENNFLNSTSSNTVVLPKLTAVAPGTYVENNQLEVTKIYLQQAKLYYAAQRWQETINACEEALKICADLPEIYKIYGNSLQQMGKFPEAMGYYAKALAIDPYYAEVYANIGSFYAKQNDWQETINYYQKALTVNPQQAKIYLHLSKAWEKVGEDERALNALFNALNLQPDILNEAQYLQLSEDLLAENKLQLAIACCEYGIKIQSPSKTLYLKLIEILEQDGQLAKATSYRQIVANLPERNSRKEHKKLKIQRLLANTSTKYLPSRKKLEPTALKALTAAVEPQEQSASDPNEDVTLSQYLEELKKQPNSATIRLKLGNLFARQQQWEKAAACYQQAIKIEPENAIAYLKLGKVCGILGKHLQGGELIYRAYSIEPEIATPEEHFKLGEFWLKQHKGKIAMSCYRRAVQLKPGFEAAYSRLEQLIALERQQATKLTASEDKTVSSSTSQTSINLNSQTETTRDRVYCQQATAAVKAQDWQLATQYYQQAIEANPQQPEYYYCLGKVQLKLDRVQTALKCFNKAAELDPNNADIQHNLGEAFSDNCDWENAATAYQKAIAIGTKNSWTYHNLGYALLQLKQWQSAADCFTRAIELKTDFVWSHYNLGEALLHLERWDEALAAYQAARQIEPGLSEAKAKIGSILYKRSQQSQQTALSFCQEQILQDPDNIELYHQAIALDKKNPELYLGLAKALIKQGKKDEALSIYQVGLQIQPQNSELIQGSNELKSAQITALSSSNLIAQIANTVNSTSGDRQTDNNFASLQPPEHSSPNKTILAIDICIPGYDKTLGARRIWELLQLFKQLNYRVIFVTDNSVEEQSNVEILQNSFIEVIYRDSEQNLSIEQQLEELLPTIDLAWVCRPQLYEKYAPLIRQHQNIELIYDTVDLHYLRLQRSNKPEDNDIQNMRQWVRMQMRELKAAHEADLTITISPVEQRILQDLGVNNLAVVPNIHRVYQNEKPEFSQRKGLLFIGDRNRSDYNYTDKVHCLVREIMPLVWSQMPELTLTLLEHNLTTEIAALGQDSRIEVTKIDSDITLHFLHHQILINPLVNDANLKENIGESLKFGLPVVSTTAGISGLNLVNEHNVLEANRTNEFVKQILRLYGDEQLWYQLAKNGEETIASYSPQAVCQTIQPMLESILAKKQ